MIFLKRALLEEIGDSIFTEIPYFVKAIESSGWKTAFLRYDAIAARLHPGPKESTTSGNAACRSSYYLTDPRQSIVKNWTDVLGKPFIYGSLLIQLKTRCPELLVSEIKTSIELDKRCLFNPGFMFCVVLSLLVPGKILHHLSLFYRNRITRLFVKEIKRNDT
jgi:hypothetical protein